MRLLLDSHAYLWWLADDPRLGPTAREAIADPESLVHVSAATIWEISIKAALGKIDLAGADLVASIGANGFLELPITGEHGRVAGSLPGHHNDPFDRMLLAQCLIEGLRLVTIDRALTSHPLAATS